jgi:hypothetical protein
MVQKGLPARASIPTRPAAADLIGQCISLSHDCHNLNGLFLTKENSK